MNNRERTKAVLNYEDYDRLPIVHFGYWKETLIKWQQEGHLTEEEIRDVSDGSEKDLNIARKLGFDYNWYTVFMPVTGLYPAFEPKILEILPDGFTKTINSDGTIILQREGAGSIPANVGHLLTDRRSWEELYKPRLQFSPERIRRDALEALRYDGERENPLGIYIGSLFGQIRNWMGVEGVSYLYVDDEELYEEIINTLGELCYRVAQEILSTGVSFDFAHYWEDICFKNGPLVKPSVFSEKVGPHYKRINELIQKSGINIISVDCDGLIDSLIPIWLSNGVNTMFPIEIGTWNADIKKWREIYGKELRGVGGMNKNVFSQDYAAIDAEIERLKPQVEMGGFIPCPDHRIPPDAKWENVQYYCDRMRTIFG